MWGDGGGGGGDGGDGDGGDGGGDDVECCSNVMCEVMVVVSRWE